MKFPEMHPLFQAWFRQKKKYTDEHLTSNLCYNLIDVKNNTQYTHRTPCPAVLDRRVQRTKMHLTPHQQCQHNRLRQIGMSKLPFSGNTTKFLQLCWK